VDSNFTTTIHGANCEIVKLAENTSDVYFRFDTETPVNLQKAGNSFYKTGNAKIIHVPDKENKNGVLYLPGISGSYAYISGFGSGCPMKIDECQSTPAYGLTVSFWFKLLKRYQHTFRMPSCGSSHYNKVIQSSESYSKQGFTVIFRGCIQGAFRVNVRSYSQTWDLTWGNTADAIWSRNWTNMAFTFLQSEGIVLYINGAEVKRQTSYSGEGVTSSYGSYIYMGKQAAGNLELYMDDLIIWFKRLISADVEFAYQRRRMDYL